MKRLGYETSGAHQYNSATTQLLCWKYSHSRKEKGSFIMMP